MNPVVPPLALTVGESFTAVTANCWVETAEVPPWPLTTKLTVRAAVFGVSLVLVYVTERSAACHCPSVAVAPAELRFSTPVASL